MHPDFFTIGGSPLPQRLGLSTRGLTAPGIPRTPEAGRQARTVLRRAVDRGARLVDVEDTAEEWVAHALHPYPAHLLVAARAGDTNAGTGGASAPDHPDRLRAQCEAGLRRLRTETIDLYRLPAADPAETPCWMDRLGVLADLRRAGKVRHIGVEAGSIAEVRRAMTITEISSVHAPYNVADRTTEDLLGFCESHRLVFVPRRPLGTGARTRSAVTAVAERHGASAAQIALAWLLGNSPVLLPVVAPSTPRQLDAYWEAAEIDLSDIDLDALNTLARRHIPA
ncbi:aldo/keto reductase (plasmid) [Embleya sp. NBC_00888]|uniref:aldo/keto reductase n=1 Tax=Embleya sp. NBC_00888 TaxID=2975960 RepID=UPI002F90F7F6|nr:aldo/keto reductase [Embleya sp. NBC_00888]